MILDPYDSVSRDFVIFRNDAARFAQTLHALRLGICLKVDRGEITLDDGTALFEAARTALMAQKQEAKRKATLREKPAF